jgi:hypothetical protein
VLDPLLVWHPPVYADMPAAWHQDAGEHLDRGGLAGAIRADVADHLARSDSERHVVHRADMAVLARQQRPHRAEPALAPHRDGKRLSQMFHFDQRHSVSPEIEN